MCNQPFFSYHLRVSEIVCITNKTIDKIIKPTYRSKQYENLFFSRIRKVS